MRGSLSVFRVALSRWHPPAHIRKISHMLLNPRLPELGRNNAYEREGGRGGSARRREKVCDKTSERVPARNIDGGEGG